MRHGFVKVAAATPDIRVADVEFNKENICRGIEEAEKAKGILAAMNEPVYEVGTIEEGNRDVVVTGGLFHE